MPLPSDSDANVHFEHDERPKQHREDCRANAVDGVQVLEEMMRRRDEHADDQPDDRREGDIPPSHGYRVGPATTALRPLADALLLFAEGDHGLGDPPLALLDARARRPIALGCGHDVLGGRTRLETGIHVHDGR